MTKRNFVTGDLVHGVGNEASGATTKVSSQGRRVTLPCDKMDLDHGLTPEEYAEALDE